MTIDGVLAKLGPDGEGYFGCDAFPILRAALARAHAEGLEAGLRQAAAALDRRRKDIEPYSTSHEGAAAAMDELDALAASIRSLIPAAPQPRPLPAGEERPAAEEAGESDGVES